jgi:Effector-associated domain 1
LAATYERLERELPEGFPALARNDAFIALLRGIGDTGTRKALHSQLVRAPLTTTTIGWSREQLNDLIDLLATLYTDLDSMRRVVSMSGLDLQRIDLDGTRPIDVAFNVVRYAEASAQLDQLIALMSRDYPHNRDLARLRA